MPAMPAMPTISNSADEGFYRPSIPRQPAQRKTEEDSAKTNGATGAVLSNATTADDIISSFLGTNQNLTADDISTLYDTGLFGSISSITNNTSNVTTNALLKQVLDSLQELKAEQKKASLEQQNKISTQIQDSKTFKQREPSILRFKLNGYSITESFTKVFFSLPEPDGTFLLSADRKYFANQKVREETVYILFKAIKSTGSSVIYEVQPSVVQTEKNDNSYIYKLSQQKNLKAEKTGNLVVLRSENSGLNVDVLLDIDN